LAEVCNRVYEHGYEGEDLVTFEARRDHKYLTRFEESIVAGDHENWVDRVIELDNRVDVLPKSLRACFAGLMEQKRWLEADALTVNIYATKKVIERHLDKSQDPWLIDVPYGANGLELP
jgi:hypothetical protein